MSNIKKIQIVQYSWSTEDDYEWGYWVRILGREVEDGYRNPFSWFFSAEREELYGSWYEFQTHTVELAKEWAAQIMLDKFGEEIDMDDERFEEIQDERND